MNKNLQGCVIGGGPSGLYVAKFLADYGIKTIIHEISDALLGNYKYARIKNDKIKNIVENNDKIKVKLNSDGRMAKDCDFYVMASGGIPRLFKGKGNQYVIPASNIIKKYYDKNLEYIGDKVCIIGMGNVTFDLLNYIDGKCKEITVLSNKDDLRTPFDNHLLAEIINNNKYKISSNECINNSNDNKVISNECINNSNDNKVISNNYNSSKFLKIKKIFNKILNKLNLVNLENDLKEKKIDLKNRKVLRRKKLIQKIKNSEVEYKSNDKNQLLKLLFNVENIEIKKKNENIKELKYKIGKKIYFENFNEIISSIGYIPNKIEIKFDKPIFNTGWCVKSKGNIFDTKMNAKNCVDEIKSYFNKK